MCALPPAMAVAIPRNDYRTGDEELTVLLRTAGLTGAGAVCVPARRMAASGCALAEPVEV
nr:hypothetical protein [Tanacetum cinerariifolium]